MLTPKEVSDLTQAYDDITHAYESLEHPKLIHKAVAMSVTMWEGDGLFNELQTAMLLAYNDGIFAGHKIASGEYHTEEE